MIYGQKAGLRLVEEEDLPLLAKWRNDPRIRAMFLTPLLISVSGQKKWYEALLNNPARMQFMIVRLEDNVPIGTLGLDHIDYRNQQAELGSGLIDPSEHGHGQGLDATRALVRYAFHDLNLHRLYGRALAFNTVALRQNEKLGMRREGIARKAVFVNGEFQDVVLLALLREEWQPDDTAPMAL